MRIDATFDLRFHRPVIVGNESMSSCARTRAPSKRAKRSLSRGEASCKTRKVRLPLVRAKKSEREERAGRREEAGTFLKAVWYAAEGFGDVMGAVQRKNGASEKADPVSTVDLISREEVLLELRDDYSKNYFISGLGEMKAYDPQCTFADPFVSFKGVDRFKKNVGNLGSLMQDVSLEILDWKEEEKRVSSKWRFSCVLDLPWRPRLAAAGGTTHEFDESTGKVIRHIEEWDIEPAKVVGDLLRPSSRNPSNRMEAFFLALSKRDAWTMWKESAVVVAYASLFFGAMSVLRGILVGDEYRLPLVWSSLCLAASATEAWTMSRGDKGKL